MRDLLTFLRHDKGLRRDLLWAAISFVAFIAIAPLTAPSQAQMLHQQFIETASGTRLGYTLDRGNRLAAYDRTGVRLGYYDKQDGFTYDRSGRRIARGDILSHLIVENRSR